MSLFLIPYLPFFIIIIISFWSHDLNLLRLRSGMRMLFFIFFFIFFILEYVISSGNHQGEDLITTYLARRGGYYPYNSAVYSARFNQLGSLIVPKKQRRRQVNWVYIKKTDIAPARRNCAHSTEQAGYMHVQGRVLKRDIQTDR